MVSGNVARFTSGSTSLKDSLKFELLNLMVVQKTIKEHQKEK